MTFDTKLTMALAGCSGSCSANKWHTLSVALPCFRATNPKTLQQERRGGQRTSKPPPAPSGTTITSTRRSPPPRWRPAHTCPPPEPRRGGRCVAGHRPGPLLAGIPQTRVRAGTEPLPAGGLSRGGQAPPVLGWGSQVLGGPGEEGRTRALPGRPHSRPRASCTPDTNYGQVRKWFKRRARLTIRRIRAVLRMGLREP